MFLFSLFCVNAVLGVYLDVKKSGWANHWDAWLDYKTPEAHGFLTGMISYHSNHHEDRRYAFYYSHGRDYGMRCISSGDKTGNSYDGWMDYKCPQNSVIYGMSALHHNKHEDRLFTVKCCDISSNGKFKIGKETESGYQNSFDGHLDYKCPPGRALIGVKSYHDNKHEDRRWNFRCGEIQPTGSYIYVGCFADDASRNFLDGPHEWGYDVASCSSICKHYKYFALQMGTWCSCGDAVQRMSHYVKKPDHECGANKRGGAWRNAVYHNGGHYGRRRRIDDRLAGLLESETAKTDSTPELSVVKLNTTEGIELNTE